jgi:xylose isomerase
MDAFARGLKIAAAIRADGELAGLLEERYRSWDSGIGARIESGSTDLEALEAYMLEKGEIAPNQSGRQEMLLNLVNRYL